jgi:transposase-like protein
MRKSRYSDAEIEAAVRQVEDGTSIAEMAGKLGISESTFHVWRKRLEATHDSVESTEIDRLRYENTELIISALSPI